MNFAACCAILQLTQYELGIDPSEIMQCTADKLENDILFIIKQSFKKLAIKLHPDKGGKNEDFKALLIAYKTALDIIEQAIAQKRNSDKPVTSVTNIRNLNAMSIDELIAYISARNPDFLTNFWDDNQTKIDDFVEKSKILNARLEKEYHELEATIFQQEFEAYRQKSDYYYNQYKYKEYNQYLTKIKQDKVDAKSKITKQYQPAIKKANNLMNLGFALFFLVFPLILSFVQWQKKRTLIQTRDSEYAEIDQQICLSHFEWEQTIVKSKEKWEQEVQYQTIDSFKENAEFSTEGLAALKSTKSLREKLALRLLSNSRLAGEVKGMQRSVESGEDFIYYSLRKECRAMDKDFSQQDPQNDNRYNLSLK